ncbi:hypothetical protein BDW74DRAFT_151378 [Aspergillus multicolor]|uniref:uncharacterized protein n=1 Tax=Aspergillus multicolor TaxID=41759 RepID=UPI003CCE0033
MAQFRRWWSTHSWFPVQDRITASLTILSALAARLIRDGIHKRYYPDDRLPTSSSSKLMQDARGIFPHPPQPPGARIEIRQDLKTCWP